MLSGQLGSSATPKQVESACQGILRRREALRNLDRLRQSGADIDYFSVDLSQPEDLAAAMRDMRARVGQVNCLIHGAGVLADRRIEDLTDEQFARVYDTKVKGLEVLLRLLGNDPLKAIVLFSSSTARLGRAGQAAYAAANEALNKIAQRESRHRPDCKTVSINWGPWDGGMVTPALRSMFASEGVGVIPLRDGAEALIRELSAPIDAVEVAMIARAVEPAPSKEKTTVIFEQAINVDEIHILDSHVLDGRPVVPLALQIEWLGHAALHGNPGLAFHGLENLRLLNGVRLQDAASTTVQAAAGPAARRGDEYVVAVELRGRRGQREVIHSSAEVVLVPRLPSLESSHDGPNLQAYPWTIEEAYSQYLFHGPQLMGIDRIEGIADSGIVGICRTAPHPNTWLRSPLRNHWLADPLVLDGAFQLMILWSFEHHGIGCLPCAVGRYRQYRRSFADRGIRVVVHVKNVAGALIRADIDFVDESGFLVARMFDHESVMDDGLKDAFRRNRLLETSVEGSAAR
jgi:NAD(P)-dependent dehydrogenase (short-subunit alcohol dehydrogenase family)